MNLLPIGPTLADNPGFLNDPDLEPMLSMTVDFFSRIGYVPPWIGYVAERDGVLVAGVAFKGPPRHGRVEIAYGVFPPYQHRGIATDLCGQLVRLARQTDPTVVVTACTLPEETFSTRVLQKNQFVRVGTVWDEEDGEVWEWEYRERTEGPLAQ